MRERKGDRLAVINHTFDSVQRQLDDRSRIARKEVKPHASAGETGRVSRLFPTQDYGFVEISGGSDLYFSRNAVADDNFDALKVGSLVRVTRAAAEGPMGPQASSVQRLGLDAPAA